MIAYLKGMIYSKGKDSVVVLVDNIGYEVSAPAPVLEMLRVGQEQELFTHEYLRENTRELYGFSTRDELRLFHDLMKVSGVGPKSALNVMSLGAAQIRDAINKGDAGILGSVSGVGKKTAQKIVLELKGVLSDANAPSADADAVDALRRLGYSQREAADALHGIVGETVEEKIKAALKVLGKR